MADTPEEPMTMLSQGSATLHELFLSYQEAGFTEDQAMRLIISVLHRAMGYNE
jgi:hypothetical protein